MDTKDPSQHMVPILRTKKRQRQGRAEQRVTPVKMLTREAKSCGPFFVPTSHVSNEVLGDVLCIESVRCTWSLTTTQVSLRGREFCASYAFCSRFGFPRTRGLWNPSRQALSAFIFQRSVPRVVCTAWQVLQTTCSNIFCPPQRLMLVSFFFGSILTSALPNVRERGD